MPETVNGTAEPCGHNRLSELHPSARESSGKASVRRLGLSLAVTAGVMVAEAIGGWLSGSLALLSDAGHMLTDVAALAVAMLAVILGSRPADSRRTYGYRRLEVLAAQLNVAGLLGITAWIIWEAVDRLRSPPHPIGLGLMAVIAVIGLAANGLILFWLQHDRSLNARSAFLHVLGDAVSSLAVLTGAGIMWLRPDLWWIDPVLSLGIALLILWGAVRLILEITDILMESVPGHLNVAEVCRMMERTDGVVAVHDLHIWAISSGMYALSAHLVVHCNSVGRNDDILTEVKTRLRDACGIDHTTLQIESADYVHVHDVHSH